MRKGHAAMPLRRMLSTFGFCAGLALTGALGLAGPARAQGAAAAPKIGLELNRLESRAEGCRVWLLLRNPAPEAVDPLRLDLLIFGKDGVIARRLALDVGPLPAEKTMARIFDLASQPCEGIGAVLLNDLLACGASAETRASCLPRLALASRVDGVSFEK
jgi:hypothetical protein